MQTKITIFRPGQAPEIRHEDMASAPGYRALAAYVEPILNGGDLCHVAVLHDGVLADMFVDDNGHLKGLPFNAPATDVYHAMALARDPDRDMAKAPGIVGTAILFHRKVWA